MRPPYNIIYTLSEEDYVINEGFDYYRPSTGELHHIVLNLRAVSHVLDVHNLVVLWRDVVFVQNPLQKKVGQFLFCIISKNMNQA